MLWYSQSPSHLRKVAPAPTISPVLLLISRNAERLYHSAIDITATENIVDFDSKLSEGSILTDSDVKRTKWANGMFRHH